MEIFKVSIFKSSEKLTAQTPSTNLPAQRQNPLSGFSTRPPNRHKARVPAQLCVLARLRLRYGGWAGPPSGGPGWFGPVLRTPFSRLHDSQLVAAV